MTGRASVSHSTGFIADQSGGTDVSAASRTLDKWQPANVCNNNMFLQTKKKEKIHRITEYLTLVLCKQFLKERYSIPLSESFVALQFLLSDKLSTSKAPFIFSCIIPLSSKW